MDKRQMIERMIRCRGIYKQDVLKSLGITRPTLIKLLNDVDLLSGYQRIKLAKILGLDVSVIDCIINTKDKDAEELTYAVLNIIKPIANDKN